MSRAKGVFIAPTKKLASQPTTHSEQVSEIPVIPPEFSVTAMCTSRLDIAVGSYLPLGTISPVLTGIFRCHCSALGSFFWDSQKASFLLWLAPWLWIFLVREIILRNLLDANSFSGAVSSCTQEYLVSWMIESLPSEQWLLISVVHK